MNTTAAAHMMAAFKQAKRYRTRAFGLLVVGIVFGLILPEGITFTETIYQRAAETIALLALWSSFYFTYLDYSLEQKHSLQYQPLTRSSLDGSLAIMIIGATMLLITKATHADIPVIASKIVVYAGFLSLLYRRVKQAPRQLTFAFASRQ